MNTPEDVNARLASAAELSGIVGQEALSRMSDLVVARGMRFWLTGSGLVQAEPKMLAIREQFPDEFLTDKAPIKPEDETFPGESRVLGIIDPEQRRRLEASETAIVEQERTGYQFEAITNESFYAYLKRMALDKDGWKPIPELADWEELYKTSGGRLIYEASHFIECVAADAVYADKIRTGGVTEFARPLGTKDKCKRVIPVDKLYDFLEAHRRKKGRYESHEYYEKLVILAERITTSLEK